MGAFEIGRAGGVVSETPSHTKTAPSADTGKFLQHLTG